MSKERERERERDVHICLSSPRSQAEFQEPSAVTSRDVTPQRDRRSVDGLASTPKKEWEGVEFHDVWHRTDYRFEKFEEDFRRWRERHPILFWVRRLYLRFCRELFKLVCCSRRRFFLPYVHFQPPYIQWGGDHIWTWS